MARPRKDECCAEERIIDAFWSVLETTPLRSISVRAVVEQAEVNRGTFYYHFADIDSLVHRALEREFVEKHSIIHEMLLLASGDIDRIPPGEINRHLNKTALLIKQGGSSRVTDEIMHITENIWQAALCPNGEPIKYQTRMFIRYNINGVVGMLTSFVRDADDESPLPQELLDFQKWNARRALESICELQGIDQQTATDRLTAALSLSDCHK